MSERELRRIAVGCKAWPFVGSDDHAEAAGHAFSLIASAGLHGLDPESWHRAAPQTGFVHAPFTYGVGNTC